MTANNQIIPVEWDPKNGGLNTDVSLKVVSEGDMPDALNIRSMGNGSFVSPEYEPIVGNHYEITPDIITVQNQEALITIDVGAAAVGYTEEFTFKRPNGTTIVYFSSTIVGSDFATTAANILADMSAGFGAAGYTYTAVVTTLSATTGTILFTLLNLPGIAAPTGWAWSLLITTTYNRPPFTVEIIQEGYDITMIGEWHQIGSFDILGDVFIMWTTQKNMPESFDIITDVVDDGSGLVELEVTDSTGFVVGQSITVSGVVGTLSTGDLSLAANGEWIIASVDPTHIVLAGSDFPALDTYVSGGTITNNIYGIGQIGVLVEDLNTYSISYTRLLISREFNWRTKKQIDVIADLKTIKKSIYFTDDYNFPRCFYYTGAYTTDGALYINNAENIYDYGQISDELKLIVNNTNSHLTFTGQTQSGGNLPAGNAIYYYRYLTNNFAATEWSEPTNPINKFQASTLSNPLDLHGDSEGTITGKVNNFTLSNIPLDIFKYVELAVIEFIGLSISAKVVGRFILNGTDTQDIQHTGFEPNEEFLDAGSLLFRNGAIDTAKNINILENRLILSNLTTSSPFDFSSFCLTVEHSIERVEIEGVGNEQEATGSTYRNGEYFDPINVNTRASYMLNDTYRFGFKFKLKNKYGGIITQPYWVDDIRIDCSATNVTTPNRRNASLTCVDYNLTTSYGVDPIPMPYVYYVDFHGFNTEYLINNIPFKELVESIIVVRSERVPEILGSGYVVPAVSSVFGGASAQTNYAGAGTPYGEYPYISGYDFATFNGFGGSYVPDNGDYPTNTTGAGYFVARRRYGSFYWMDNIYDNSEISFLPSDALYVYGNPSHSSRYPNNDPTLTTYNNQYIIFDGATNIAVKPSVNVIIDADYMSDGTQVGTVSGQNYSKNLQMLIGGPAQQNWTQPKGLVLNVTADLTDASGVSQDLGFYICQYYREISDYVNYDPDTCKYGSRSFSEYTTTGTYLDLTADLPSVILVGTVKAFGGDVFTQKTFFKNRYPYNDEVGLTTDMGFGSGIAFYSQNVINSQMRNPIDLTTPDIYPKQPIYEWLDEPGTASANTDPSLAYNFSYNLKNNIATVRGYDPLLPVDIDLGATIIWSDIKADGSIIDSYRLFPPLNLKYLSASDGDITHHLEANGELLTAQQRRFLRLFFNSNALISTQEGSEVITGSGAVLQRKGQTLSSYGSKHKWSFIKGKSRGGHDIVYYFDAENKIMMRIGADGSVPISIIHKMHSWFDNNTTWVYNNDTPADDFGICGYWNQEFLEAGWTFRGKKVLPEWSDITIYETGSYVNLSDNAIFSTFEKFDTIYLATGTPSVGVRPDDDIENWTRVPVSNGLFYNFYTIVWSEAKNKFQAYHSYRPRIYTQMKNFIGSTRPVSDTGRWYKHNKGNICQWYDDDTTVQEEDGYIVAVTNYPRSGVKTFVSQQFDCDIIPYRTEWETNGQSSYATQSDFLFLEGKGETHIYNDVSTTNDPKADGGLMYGDFITTKFIFQQGINQKLSSLITRLYIRAINWMAR